jgi:hypothetical protein
MPELMRQASLSLLRDGRQFRYYWSRPAAAMTSDRAFSIAVKLAMLHALRRCLLLPFHSPTQFSHLPALLL